MYEPHSEAMIDSIDGSPEDVNPPQSLTPTEAQKRFVELWVNRVKKSRRERRLFHEKAKKAVHRYALDEENIEQAEYSMHYPLLWSNVQVMRGAMYTSTPIPDVRRRNASGNQVHNALSVALERGLSYMLDTQDFDGNLNRALVDYLVPGLAQCRVVYEADIEQVAVVDPKTMDVFVDEMGQEVMMPDVRDQRVWIQHVPWDQFDWDECMNWEDCNWVCFTHWMEKVDIRDQFGDVNLTNIAESKKKEGKTKYRVYEIWDKRFKRVIFLADGLMMPLKITKDVLGLRGFFPCPKPMMANVTPTKFQPTPEYTYYQKQEMQIDRLTRRIHSLTANSTVDRGFYDAGVAEELNQLANSDDGEYIPIPNLRQKMQAQGSQGGSDLFASVVAQFPLENTAKVIQILQAQRESELNHVYQITGISDIMRGYSKASETLGAQEIKQASASNRIATHRKLFDCFVRDIFRIVSDVSANHLTPESWLMQTGIPVNDEMEALMRDNVLRHYVVDIESDSTVAQDSEHDKKQTMEAVKVTQEALANLMPMMAQGLPADIVQALLQTVMKPFKVTRNFEAAIQQLPSTQQQMEQMQQQLQEFQQENNELNAQLQQAMEKIASFDMREQARKDREVDAEVRRDDAQAERLEAEAATEPSVRVLNLAKAHDAMQPDQRPQQ